jgi:spore germination cell wall hydrolase CwlJ-like protein
VIAGLLAALLGLFRSKAQAQAPAAPEAPLPAPVPVQAPAAATWPVLSGTDRDVLIRTLYGEARGEAEAGQVAVVHVVRNRAKARGTGAAVECQRPWQFSCWNAADPNRAVILALATSSAAYQRLGQVVDRAWAAADVTGGARHYHATSMKPFPSWATSKGARVTATIGGHVFYAGVA